MSLHSSHQHYLSLLVAIAVAFISVPCSADILINGYSHKTNDRFTNDSSFILNGFDLSGVGRTEAGRWATAISPNVVISAYHYRPSGDVLFYSGNDATATPVTRTITSGQRISGTDLYLGLLGENLPTSITHYSVASTPLSGTPSTWAQTFFNDAGIYQDATAYSFGVSPFDVNSDPTRSVANDQAVGRNQVTAYGENVSFNSTDNDSLLFRQDSPGDPGFIDHEAKLRSGDSGAPTFIDAGGNELLLLGTNGFLYTDIDGSVYNGINYTGNQETMIRDFVSSNAILISEDASAVPEASSLLSMAFVLVPIMARRRPRRKRA